MAFCENALSVNQSKEIRGRVGRCQNDTVESQTQICCIKKRIWCGQRTEMRTELGKFFSLRKSFPHESLFLYTRGFNKLRGLFSPCPVFSQLTGLRRAEQEEREEMSCVWQQGEDGLWGKIKSHCPPYVCSHFWELSAPPALTLHRMTLVAACDCDIWLF